VGVTKAHGPRDISSELVPAGRVAFLEDAQDIRARGVVVGLELDRVLVTRESMYRCTSKVDGDGGGPSRGELERAFLEMQYARVIKPLIQRIGVDTSRKSRFAERIKRTIYLT